MIGEHFFADRDTLSQHLAGEIGSRLEANLKRRGLVSLVLSGGTSPVATLRHLREHELPWERVQVTLSDERWVPAEHPDSNAAMLAREFFQGPAAAANFYGLYRDAAEPATVAEEVADSLAPVMRPFDLVLLGMGADGHTASLFPDSPGLRDVFASHADVAGVEREGQSQQRITLTPAALTRAAEIVLLFFGDAKRSVYERALEAGPVAQLPVRAVLQQRKVPVRVYWAP